MKPLLLLLLGLAARFLLLPAAGADDKNHIPARADVLRIDIDFGHVWFLDIRPDGSARLGYGSMNFQPDLPAGTFDFNSTYQKLTTSLLPYGEFPDAKDGQPPISVCFHERRKTTFYGRFTTKPDFALALLNSGKDKLKEQGNTTIDATWRGNPPARPPKHGER